MTVCLVIEFSNLFQQYWSESWYQTLTASYGFIDTLKQEDYVAVVAYDMRPEILSDFTTDRQATHEAMQRLRIAAFSESNLFDALTDTADRMSGNRRAQGHRADLLRHRHLQQADLRQDPQDHPAGQRAHLRHRSDAGAARVVRRPRRHGPHPAAGFPAGRQPAPHLHQGDRRPGVLPAILRRVSEHLPPDFRSVAQPVLAGLPAIQSRRATASSARSRSSSSTRRPGSR